MYANIDTLSLSSPAPDLRLQKPKYDRPGRPRALDEAKCREICALIAGGCSLHDAARYVRCSVNTIRREAQRNAEFGERLRDSEAQAKLIPLRAMQRAAGTHWRAAAWLLERLFPEAFGRRSPGIFGAREARAVMKEVLSAIRDEVPDPIRSASIENRIRAVFEYHILSVCDEIRDTRSLQQALKFFDQKDKSTFLADLLGSLTTSQNQKSPN